MSATAPSTPENAAPAVNTAVKRSFTVPPKLAQSHRARPAETNDGSGKSETLFFCPSAKVVSFSASESSNPDGRRASLTNEGDASEKGSHSALPWTSSTERTLAAGPLRISKMPGSASFISSGSLLHAILPKSQCWCVDGESKFVLRIRRDSYYRIELPSETEEDKQRAEEMKGVLKQVLQFEKTLCPFKRGFHVELPSLPETPVKVRKWKNSERAKRWRLEGIWLPEGVESPLLSVSQGDSFSTSEDDERMDGGMDSQLPTGQLEKRSSDSRLDAKNGCSQNATIRPLDLNDVPTVEALSRLGRRVSSPPVIPSRAEQTADISDAESIAPSFVSFYTPEEEGVAYLSSSLDSFHSAPDILSQAHSPPFTSYQLADASDDLFSLSDNAHTGSHKRGVSDITITASSAYRLLNPTTERTASLPSTPPLIDDSDSASTPPCADDIATPPDVIRLRRLSGLRRRRSFSPLPDPTNLIDPTICKPQRRRTRSIVKNTFALLLGPSARLILLLINVAANLTGGVLVAQALGSRRRNKIPGTWESSGDEDSEDDYGIPLRNLRHINKG